MDAAGTEIKQSTQPPMAAYNAQTILARALVGNYARASDQTYGEPAFRRIGGRTAGLLVVRGAVPQCGAAPMPPSRLRADPGWDEGEHPKSGNGRGLRGQADAQVPARCGCPSRLVPANAAKPRAVSQLRVACGHPAHIAAPGVGFVSPCKEKAHVHL